MVTRIDSESTVAQTATIDLADTIGSWPEATYVHRASWSESSGPGGGEQIILEFSKHWGEWNFFYITC